MRSLILAAGRGSRMGGATRRVPKCMTLLEGRPLIAWQADALARAGADDVAVVVGYRAARVRLPGAARFLNPRWRKTNMVRSLERADRWLAGGPCVVSYSDIVYGPEPVRRLASCRADVAVTYDRRWLAQWKARFSDPLKDAETFRVDSRGRVVDIGRKPRVLSEVRGQYMGLLRFTPRGWRRTRAWLARLPGQARDRLDMTSLLRGLVEAGVPVLGVPVDGGWFEVDSLSDLAACRRWLRAGGLGPQASRV